MNFSSQLKHKSRSLRLASSSGVRRFKGKGEGLAGEGNSGRLGVVKGIIVGRGREKLVLEGGQTRRALRDS